MTELSPTCLLCEEKSLTTVDEIHSSDITLLYKNSFGVEVDRLFRTKTIQFQKCQSCDLRFFNPPVVGDEQFYHDMQRFTWYYQADKPEYHFVASMIGDTDQVLDIGCGKGLFANIVGPGRYVGLDSSPKAQEQARLAGIRVELGTIQQHALLHKGKYDVVCGFQVLEHVDGINGFIASSVECLRAGGLLIYSVPSEDSFLSQSSNATTNLPPHHVSRWTDKALERIGELFSLNLLQIHHDEVSKEHLSSYGQTVVVQRLMALLGKQFRLVNMSLLNRIMNKVGWVLGPIAVSKKTSAMGHTVTIVLQKR